MKRLPDYWARDLGVRKGQFNFDRVVYRLYRDRAVSMEAFKAGEFDMLQEFVASQYVRGHQGAKWRDGKIVKQIFDHEMGQGHQAYLLNMRRPIFQDRRVREALDYTYDFEKINLYGMRKRAYSLFSNSDFAAQGLPSPGELAILEPFRAKLPPEVFGMPYVPPRTDTSANALRENLKKARSLLEQAGLEHRRRGRPAQRQGRALRVRVSRNAGQPAVPQRDLGSATWPRSASSSRCGRSTSRSIASASRCSTSTSSPSARRTSRFRRRSTTSSSSARRRPTRKARATTAGVKDPAVDAALQAMADAKTYEQLRDASRALDRLVMHGHYQVPQLFSPGYLMSYWNKFGIPPQPELLHDGRVHRDVVADLDGHRVVDEGRGARSASRLADASRCCSTSSSACCS